MDARLNHNKGWHGRGYLPHCDIPNIHQGITFRLAESVPAPLIEEWKIQLSWAELELPGNEAEMVVARQKLHDHIARYEDKGSGECHLRVPEIAELVVVALKFFDGQRYELKSWCVMPNHVHVLIQTLPGCPLGKIVQSWKSRSARQINQVLGRSGQLWAPDYYDRYIRDAAHYSRAVRYVHENPVKAGLCQRAEDWSWSSAADLRGAADC